MSALWQPSPNFGPRRDGARPDIIVLHYTAMPSAQSALTRLCLAEAEVSAHYLIGRCGTVWQLVQEDQRAWHAGVGAWGDVRDVNSRSIGIEIDNDGYSPFSHRAMVALEGLLPGILQRWAIPPERVIGHQDMAPGRKIDPGRRFDWRRLACGGLSIWPQVPPPVPPAQTVPPFQQSAEAFGYRGAEEDVLAAFRARFRPGATGPENAEDRRVMAALAARYPVDPGGAGA